MVFKTTTETTIVATPQDIVENEIIHSTNNLDMTSHKHEIGSERNITIESGHINDVVEPDSMAQDYTDTTDAAASCIDTDVIIDDNGNPSPPNNIDSSITNNTVGEKETEGSNDASITSPPSSTFPINGVEAPDLTATDAMVSSMSYTDMEITTTAPTAPASVDLKAELVVANNDHHDRDQYVNAATSEAVMVVEADEETSNSNSFHDNILPTNEELVLPNTNADAGIDHKDVPSHETAESLDEIIVDDPTPTIHESEQLFLTDDDPSSDTTTTTTTITAPHPENYVPKHRSKQNNDVVAVSSEIIPEVVVPVEVVADTRTTTFNSNSNSYHHNKNQMLSPMTPSPNVPKQRPMKKLLLLISTNSIDRQVKVRQDLVQTALTAANIDYDVIDGSIHENETNIILRNELFALSGLRGLYPQFFIVNLAPPNVDNGSNGTGTSFWGTFEQFQHVNDDGQLRQVFGSTGITLTDNKTIARKLYPSETLPSVGEISNDNEHNSKGKSTTMTVPDDVYVQFSQQIQRIEENYQLERQQTEQQHMQKLERQQQLYQQCELEKRELDEKLSNEIRQKDEQLQEMYRRDEGYRLKLDVLKREVTGTQELVQGRDQELQKANQKYLNDLRAMEKQFNNAEKSAIKFQEEAQSIQTRLDNTEAELLSSKQEYETIKERAKDIAAELKHRRSECRQLQDSVAELTEQNNQLKSTVHSLEERLNHQGLNQSDKDKEIESLRAKLTEATQEMKTIEIVWQERLTKNENILTEYKKRAQHSLSMSNSRTAAAVLAREEAELDTRAARSTADAASERSVKAEVECREAIAMAQLRVKALEVERDEAMTRLDQMKQQLLSAETLQFEKERDLESSLSISKNKDIEIDRLRGCMNDSDAKIASTQQKIMDSTNTIDDLREEISVLRDELQRATTSAVNVVSVQSDDDGTRCMKYAPSQILVNGSHEDAEDGDTLAALQMELREANDAIEDLKSALKNAIEMNQEQQSTASASGNGSTFSDTMNRSDVGHTNSAETIPLFYAMEKQAELKTARTEMNRLASLLADVQSEKMEAYDAMDDMRRKLEEAESRLKRNAKLGMIPNVPNSTKEASDENSNASAVNIEYLKHILLRFMNAKTQTERKTLIPVIGAVLELTPDEVVAATQNIDRHSASIVTSNGSGLFSFLS